MISNLPLLFADGQPTCLEKISIGQLEKFIPFMVQCSCAQNDVKKLTAPPWWPPNLAFSIPLLKPEVADSKWLLILKNLVYRCYHFHQCDFMLRFCAELSQLSTSELRYVNSWDGTTSLYNKTTGKLLVTFRNENLFYDRKKNSPKKTLLSRSHGESGERPAMVQPPLYDVYLCDNCDEEFNTLKEVQDHEKSCCSKQRQPTPPCVTEADSKECFLRYFTLASTKENTVKIIDQPLRKRGFRNSLRYSSIPISSPLGLLVYRKTRASPSTSAVQLERLERHCPAKPSSVNLEHRVQGSTPWPVSWKPRKKAGEEDWVHVYSNPGRQWKGRTRTSVKKKVSNKKQSLLDQCRNLHVHVRKLTPREIALYTNATSSSKGASVASVVEDSKCIHLSRHSSNSLHLPPQKLSKGSVDNKNSKRQSFDVPTSLIKQPTSNGKSANISKTAVNKNQVHRSAKTIVSPKVTNNFSVSTLFPQITSEYKTEPSKPTFSKAASCELTCIPVIDLVSSDEECEVK